MAKLISFQMLTTKHLTNIYSCPNLRYLSDHIPLPAIILYLISSLLPSVSMVTDLGDYQNFKHITYCKNINVRMAAYTTEIWNHAEIISSTLP